MAVTEETLKRAAELKAAVDALLAQLARKLTKGWADAWDRLEAAFALAVAELIAANEGRWPSRRQVNESKRLGDALKAAAAEHQVLVDLLRVAGTAAAAKAASLAGKGQAGLISSQLPTGHGRAFVSFADEALAAIVRRTGQQITSLSRPLSAEATAAMKAELIRGIEVGEHPDTVARAMVRRVEGQFAGGLGRAILISRTELLDAYRSAAMASQLANSDVLRGWLWLSELSPRTCFPAGTEIRSMRGDVPIEEIEIGDVVLTHTGNWRRVAQTMRNPYAGELFTIEAGRLKVSATADHPFLVERQGELQWLEARHVRLGDAVLSDLKSVSNQVDHGLGEVAVERCGDQPDDRVPEPLKDGSLLRVPLGDLRMPVGLIDLNGDHPLAQEEVDRTLPSLNGLLGDVGGAECFEGEPDVALGDCLPSVSPVAAPGAEAPNAEPRRNDPHSLPAREAFDLAWRSAARLRAVLVGLVLRPEDSPTSFAWPVYGLGPKALVGTMNFGSLAQGNMELPLTPRADLQDAPSTARHRAVRPGLVGAGLGLRSAGCARSDDGWLWGPAASPSAVGCGGLMGGIANLPAELTSATSDPRRRDLEISSTVLASPLHRHIVSGIAIDRISRPVFNIGVEGDHSYLANGVAVHNCGSCWVMHGTEHPLDEPGPDDHPNGRCSRTPITRSWKDLGINIPEPPSIIPNARERFDALPQADRLAVMGPGRLDLLDRGQIKWSDLSTQRDNPGWRTSRNTTALRDLVRS